MFHKSTVIRLLFERFDGRFSFEYWPVIWIWHKTIVPWSTFLPNEPGVSETDPHLKVCQTYLTFRKGINWAAWAPTPPLCLSRKLSITEDRPSSSQARPSPLLLWSEIPQFPPRRRKRARTASNRPIIPVYRSQVRDRFIATHCYDSRKMEVAIPCSNWCLCIC